MNYDADVLIPPLQLYLAVEKIILNEADFVSPYDGRFVCVPKEEHVNIIIKDMDLGYLNYKKMKGSDRFDSLGGCIIYNRQKFIEAGMENENFISYAPEDKERYWRFQYLGYKLERTKGPLFHLEHFRGPDSSHKHIHYPKNQRELDKEMNMSKKELLNYIKTWSWIPKESL